MPDGFFGTLGLYVLYEFIIEFVILSMNATCKINKLDEVPTLKIKILRYFYPYLEDGLIIFLFGKNSYQRVTRLNIYRY